jgi:hypothetical protein
LVTDTNVQVAIMITAQAESWCTASADCVAFTFRCNDTSATVSTCTATEEAQVREVYFKGETAANGDPEWATFVQASDVPATHVAQQVWGKPLPGGTWAILAINANTDQSMEVSLPLAALNLSGPVTATDIWKYDGEPATGGPVAKKFEPPAVGPRDSGFFKLSPPLG